MTASAVRKLCGIAEGGGAPFSCSSLRMIEYWLARGLVQREQRRGGDHTFCVRIFFGTYSSHCAQIRSSSRTTTFCQNIRDFLFAIENWI